MKSILKKVATDDEFNERNDIDQNGEYIIAEGDIKDLIIKAKSISEACNGEEVEMRIVDKDGTTRHTFDENGMIN